MFFRWHKNPDNSTHHKQFLKEVKCDFPLRPEGRSIQVDVKGVLADERIYAIKDLLESGEKPWPIYVDSAHDDFVMEGRHKMVAFYELGIEEIDVCRVTFKEENKPEIKSKRRNRP